MKDRLSACVQIIDKPKERNRNEFIVLIRNIYSISIEGVRSGKWEWKNWLRQNWLNIRNLCANISMTYLKTFNTLRDKVIVILKCIFLIEIYKLRLGFYWSLFPRVQVTTFQHWFRKRLGAVQATNHYLNQWWLVYSHIYPSFGFNELKMRIRIKVIYRQSTTNGGLCLYIVCIYRLMSIVNFVTLVGIVYPKVIGDNFENYCIWRASCIHLMENTVIPQHTSLELRPAQH